jgi:hypothetical protein
MVRFREFALQTNAFYLSATYGLTSRLDVNLLMPLLLTMLSSRQTATTQALGSLPPGPRQQGQSFGLGDVQFRSKYMLLDAERWALATLLWLRAPTGDEKDFHGLGDWTVRPELAFSIEQETLGEQSFGVQANLGVDIDASQLPRTRVLYGVGLSYRVLPRFTANLELVGASQIAANTRSQFVSGVAPPALGLENFPGIAVSPAAGGTNITQRIPRQDVVELAPGMKWQHNRTVVFASVLIPLTNDGARAAAIPVVGFDLRF